MRKLNRYKRKVDPFASLWCQIIKLISEASTKDLKYILNNYDLLKTTNCWWAQYTIVPIMENEIRIELSRRKRRKSKKLT